MCSLTMKHIRVVSLNARQAKPGVHLVDTTWVAQMVVICPHGTRGCVHGTRSVPSIWLVMTWCCKELGHQQPWCGSSSPEIFQSQNQEDENERI